MNSFGFEGLEIAPTRIFPENPYGKLAEAREWKSRLTDVYGFQVPSMQSIWYGRTECIFKSQFDRAVLTDYTKKAVDFASAIGCRNLVFGCPKNRTRMSYYDPKVAVTFFREIGEYAASKNTVIGMEANPPIYQTNFINTTQSAIELIEEVDSKGFKLNLDLGAVIENREDICELKGKVDLISHVHVSEPGLVPIERRALHYNVRELLMSEGYSGYVSIEMAKTDSIATVKNSMEYVKEIFS